jgi:hypothetical protein
MFDEVDFVVDVWVEERPTTNAVHRKVLADGCPTAAEAHLDDEFVVQLVR